MPLDIAGLEKVRIARRQARDVDRDPVLTALLMDSALVAIESDVRQERDSKSGSLLVIRNTKDKALQDAVDTLRAALAEEKPPGPKGGKVDAPQVKRGD